MLRLWLRTLRSPWLSGVVIAIVSTLGTLLVVTNFTLFQLAENYLSDMRVALIMAASPGDARRDAAELLGIDLD